MNTPRSLSTLRSALRILRAVAASERDNHIVEEIHQQAVALGLYNAFDVAIAYSEKADGPLTRSQVATKAANRIARDLATAELQVSL